MSFENEKLQESAQFKCILLKSFSGQFLILIHNLSFISCKAVKTLDFCHVEAWSFMQDRELKKMVEKHFL